MNSFGTVGHVQDARSTRDSAICDVLARAPLPARLERLSRVERDYPLYVPPLATERPSHRAARAKSRELDAALRLGTYRPFAAYKVAVPRRVGPDRTISLLTLEDRMVYESLVRPVRPLVEAALRPREVLFGPGGKGSVLRWKSFARAPLRSSPALVVSADVRDCHAAISHVTVGEALERVGCERARTAALVDFLGSVMQSSQGLPSRTAPTECLVTAVLASVDGTMTAAGWAYFRCSDDFRLAVSNRSRALDSLTSLETALAEVGLQLAPGKTRIDEATSYSRELSEEPMQNLWETASRIADGRLLHARPAVAARLAIRRVSASPSRRAAAAVAAAQALVEPPSEADERVVISALELLTVARDPAVLALTQAILERYPRLGGPVSRYLRSLIASPTLPEAERTAIDLLRGGTPHPAHVPWLLRALLPAARALDAGFAELLGWMVAAPESSWPTRIEAARLLAARGEQPFRCVKRPAAAPPPQFEPELALIAAGGALAVRC